MGIKAWIHNLARKSEALYTLGRSRGGLTSFLLGGSTKGMLGNSYMSIVSEALLKNPIYFSCIDLIATSVADITPLVYEINRKGELIEITDPSHPLKALVAAPSPNPEQSWAHIMYKLTLYEYCGGIGYLYGNRVSDRTPVRELYALRPDMVTPQTGDSIAFPVGSFSYYPERGTALENLLPVGIDGPGTGSIMRFLRTHPFDELKGLPSAIPAGRSVLTNNEGRLYNLNALTRNGIPPGILRVKEGADNLDMDVLEELQKRWEQKYGGAVNAGKIPVMGMLEFQPIGANPKDMAYREGQQQTSLEIAITNGVPPELLGDTEHKTYNNAEEARAFFTVFTILPRVNRNLAQLAAWLGPQHGGNYVFGYDADKIDALQYLRTRRYDQVEKSSSLTLDEKREVQGYGALDGDLGKVVLIPGTMVPLDRVVQGDDGGEA